MIIDDIVAAKKQQLNNEKSFMCLNELKSRIKTAGKNRLKLFDALKKDSGVSIIAEIKKASPSSGLIRNNIDPADYARNYMREGACAISVLTEKNYFQGEDDYLYKVKQSVSIPVLRKDFIIDIWQVYQSAYYGADAILLIASLLNDDELKKYLIVAGILGMECLVEVHNEAEAYRSIEAGAAIIGINNRDLKDFSVNLDTTFRILNVIPHTCAVVSESGISSREDIRRLKEAGVDGALIGGAIMTAEDPFLKLKELAEEGKSR